MASINSAHVIPRLSFIALTWIIHGIVSEIMRSSFRRGKVAGVSRPLDQETWDGSVERWMVETGYNMFHFKCTGSGPSSGTGAMRGLILTCAPTMRTNLGSSTGPSTSKSRLASETNQKSKVLKIHTRITLSKVIYSIGHLARRFRTASCPWGWVSRSI